MGEGKSRQNIRSCAGAAPEVLPVMPVGRATQRGLAAPRGEAAAVAAPPHRLVADDRPPAPGHRAGCCQVAVTIQVAKDLRVLRVGEG